MSKFKCSLSLHHVPMNDSHGVDHKKSRRDFLNRTLAFELLEQAVETRESILLQAKVDPHFSNLHSDPRWPKLMRKIKEPGK